MAGGVEVVRIEGLKALQKDLRDLDQKLPRELRKVNLSVAQMVAEHARGAASSQGGIAAAAAGRLKARAEQRSAAVVLTAGAPGTAAGGALGAEFGAGHDSNRSRRSGQYKGYNQFKMWRGNGPDAGYFMYPTVRADNDQIVDAYLQRVTELLNQVFPD
jgi:hypothetical protein